MAWLCTYCYAECEPNPDICACPHCGDAKRVPVDLADTETVTLPWQMVRILTHWAERWAGVCEKHDPDYKAQKLVYNICDRILIQTAKPRGGLTLSSELADLRGAGHTVEVYDADGTKREDL